jgi:hypothetical protein
MPSAGIIGALSEALKALATTATTKGAKKAQTPVFAPPNWVAGGDRSRAVPCQ